jgi:hypothetical protein
VEHLSEKLEQSGKIFQGQALLYFFLVGIFRLFQNLCDEKLLAGVEHYVYIG